MESPNYKFINICGLGFVGGSMSYLCKQNKVGYSVYDVIDKEDPSAIAIFKDLTSFVKHSEQENNINFYLISVPTPSKETGECNTTIVESVIDQLFQSYTKKTIVLIKSTVQPGTCRNIYNKYNLYNNSNFQIVFVPEFLTERRANLDMYEAKFAMFGTHDGSEPSDVVNLFRKLYKHNEDIEIVIRKYEICELFKYTINSYLGVKVWFFNEIYQICEKLNVEYDNLHSLLSLDPRIGMSHTNVPGPDGKFGFGGACLPKENRGFSYLQNHLGIPNTILTEIHKRNTELRNKSVKED
jgi:UDPglucose 6-dehydrogenase